MKALSTDNFASIMVDREDQKALRRTRSSHYVYRKVSKAEFSGNAEDGWSVAEELKFQIKLQKAKPSDERFEDKVWTILSRAGFEFISRDRKCVLSYGSAESENQQVDVLAVDDEVAVIVECKCAADGPPQQGKFKTEIESLAGKRQGLISSLRKLFDRPQLKVAFVLATNNYRLSEQDLERLEAAGIKHFAEADIEYYAQLVDHLGTASRYQLEADLFPNQGIPGMESRVHAIKGKMGGYTYFTFMIEPERLLKIAYVLHRSKSIRLLPTYQRLIKKQRLKSISKYVADGGYFPNSLIISIDAGKRGPKFEPSEKKIAESDVTSGILHLPQKYRSAYIIDGQHRLYSYAGLEEGSGDTVPVVAFVNLDRAEQLRQFMDINENQKSVSTNLRHTLDADLKWDSDNLRERAIGFKKSVAQMLGDDVRSPLYGRVLLGEDQRTETRIITLDSIVKGIDKTRLVGEFTKDKVIDQGLFSASTAEKTLEQVCKFLYAYFDVIAQQASSEWVRLQKDDGFLQTADGIHALIAVLGDILDHLVEAEQIKRTNEKPTKILDEASALIYHMTKYVETIPPKDREDIRSRSGSGAPVRLRRILQRAINAEDEDFVPEGFVEYWRDQSKQYNLDTYSRVHDIEKHLKETVRERLESIYGPMWLKKGLPPKIYTESHSLAAQKNRTIEKAEDERTAWDCMYLINYREIMLHGGQWSNVFQKDFTPPGLHGAKKEDKTAWLVRLNEIRNRNDHEYSVTKEEADYVEAIHSWLCIGDPQKLAQITEQQADAAGGE